MSYELSFSADFFSHHGEEELGEPELNSEGLPVSVASALLVMMKDEPARFDALCEDNGIDPTSESAVSELLDVVKRINTCSNIDTPVRVWLGVWLDEEGWEWVRVYESR